MRDEKRKTSSNHDLGLGIFLLFVVSCLSFPFGCDTQKKQQASNPHDKLFVFAAASLRDVITKVGDVFTQQRGIEIVYNFAGSNVLAHQINAAPIADLFLSASEKWIDVVESAGNCVPDSRCTLLTNRLVVICHRDSRWMMARPEQLADLDFKYLAMANPEAVPAGRYAKEWLQSVSLWDRCQRRVAPTPDVRAALALVEADPRIVGIVYHTDAVTSDRVRSLFEIPADQGPTIRYVAAAIAGRQSTEHALEFLQFLKLEKAAEIFKRGGFMVPR